MFSPFDSIDDNINTKTSTDDVSHCEFPDSAVAIACSKLLNDIEDQRSNLSDRIRIFGEISLDDRFDNQEDLENVVSDMLPEIQDGFRRFNFAPPAPLHKDVENNLAFSSQKRGVSKNFLRRQIGSPFHQRSKSIAGEHPSALAVPNVPDIQVSSSPINPPTPPQRGGFTVFTNAIDSAPKSPPLARSPSCSDSNASIVQKGNQLAGKTGFFGEEEERVLHFYQIGTGPVKVLLVHGIMMTSSFWLWGIFRHLPPESYKIYSFVCPDLLGFGQSNRIKRETHFTITEQAKRLEEDVLSLYDELPLLLQHDRLRMARKVKARLIKRIRSPAQLFKAAFNVKKEASQTLASTGGIYKNQVSKSGDNSSTSSTPMSKYGNSIPTLNLKNLKGSTLNLNKNDISSTNTILKPEIEVNKNENDSSSNNHSNSSRQRFYFHPTIDTNLSKSTTKRVSLPSSSELTKDSAFQTITVPSSDYSRPVASPTNADVMFCEPLLSRNTSLLAPPIFTQQQQQLMNHKTPNTCPLSIAPSPIMVAHPSKSFISASGIGVTFRRISNPQATHEWIFPASLDLASRVHAGGPAQHPPDVYPLTSMLEEAEEIDSNCTASSCKYKDNNNSNNNNGKNRTFNSNGAKEEKLTVASIGTSDSLLASFPVLSHFRYITARRRRRADLNIMQQLKRRGETSSNVTPVCNGCGCSTTSPSRTHQTSPRHSPTSAFIPSSTAGKLSSWKKKKNSALLSPVSANPSSKKKRSGTRALSSTVHRSGKLFHSRMPATDNSFKDETPASKGSVSLANVENHYNSNNREPSLKSIAVSPFSPRHPRSCECTCHLHSINNTSSFLAPSPSFTSLNGQSNKTEICILDGRERTASFHLVGHSFGCLVLLRLARLRPERIRSILLLTPAIFQNKDPVDNLSYMPAPVSLFAANPRLARLSLSLAQKFRNFILPVARTVVPRSEIPRFALEDFFSCDPDCLHGTLLELFMSRTVMHDLEFLCQLRMTATSSSLFSFNNPAFTPAADFWTANTAACKRRHTTWNKKDFRRSLGASYSFDPLFGTRLYNASDDRVWNEDSLSEDEELLLMEPRLSSKSVSGIMQFNSSRPYFPRIKIYASDSDSMVPISQMKLLERQYGINNHPGGLIEMEYLKNAQHNFPMSSPRLTISIILKHIEKEENAVQRSVGVMGLSNAEPLLIC